jgi:hypothetical protein
MNLFKFEWKNLPKMSTVAVCMCGVPILELSRVVVLGSRPVEGDTVNELIKSRTLLLKEYTWVSRAVYKCSR